MKLDRLTSRPVFDLQGTLSRLAGDEELLSDMVGFFVEDAPRLLAELQAAVAAQDAEAIQTTAHAIKGSLLGCGGVRAGHTAQRVEDVAAAGELDAAAPLVEVLSSEIDMLVEATLPYRR
jgi:two-component system, sensor histidine kinase and response regulator